MTSVDSSAWPNGTDAANTGLEKQAVAWDEWLVANRVLAERDRHTLLRAAAVSRALAAVPVDARRTILDVGAGDGYDSVQFAAYGRVTATDLAPETIADASVRYSRAGVKYVAGDFLTMPFPDAPYDVIVTLETIAHVYDQPGFVQRAAALLRPGGYLILTTQNKDVYDFGGHPPAKGYLRRWLNRRELADLLRPFFEVRHIRTVAPAEPGTLRKAPDGRTPPLSLRLAYSYRVNRIANRILGATTLGWLKERAGIARTLVAVATRR